MHHTLEMPITQEQRPKKVGGYSGEGIILKIIHRFVLEKTDFHFGQPKEQLDSSKVNFLLDFTENDGSFGRSSSRLSLGHLSEQCCEVPPVKVGNGG